MSECNFMFNTVLKVRMVLIRVILLKVKALKCYVLIIH